MLSRARGQGMLEYALIIALVAVVVIASLVVLGPQISRIFLEISNQTVKTPGEGCRLAATALLLPHFYTWCRSNRDHSFGARYLSTMAGPISLLSSLPLARILSQTQLCKHRPKRSIVKTALSEG